ncbi:hypothetical protein CL620_05280 [archaeon]|nr:hypothetical protein [archaeon]
MIHTRTLSPLEIEVGFETNTLSNSQIQSFLHGEKVIVQEEISEHTLRQEKLTDLILETSYSINPVEGRLPITFCKKKEEQREIPLALGYLDSQIATGVELANLIEPLPNESRRRITKELPVLGNTSYSSLEAEVAEVAQVQKPRVPRVVGKIHRKNNPLYATGGSVEDVAPPTPSYSQTTKRKSKRGRLAGLAAAAVLATVAAIGNYTSVSADKINVKNSFAKPVAAVSYNITPAAERSAAGCLYIVQPGDGYEKIGMKTLGSSKAGRRLQDIYANETLHPGQYLDVCPENMKIGAGSRMYNTARGLAKTFGGKTRAILAATRQANPGRNLSKILKGASVKLPQTIQQRFANLYNRKMGV